MGHPAPLGSRGEPCSALERLLGSAELRDQSGAVRLDRRRRSAEPALLAERDPVLEGSERTDGAVQRVPGDREVVLKDCSVSAGPTREVAAARSLHLGQAARTAEVGASKAAV